MTLKANPVSSYALSNLIRGTIAQGQSALLTAQQEMASGQHADMGLALGVTTGQTISLQKNYDQLSAILDTNGIVASQMDAAQTALSSMVSNAQSFVSSLSGARNAVDGAAIITPLAAGGLQGATDLMNTSYGGQYIFGGINTGSPPIANFTATGAAKTAFENDFQAKFGMAITDPNVSTISASDIQDFINNEVTNEFSGSQWSTNWSSASDQVVQSRIAPQEMANTSVSANDPGVRKLMMAYTMTSELAGANLNSGAYTTVIDSAMSLTQEGINSITTAQSVLGTSQAQVTDANTRLTAQSNVLQTSVNNLESVDPYQAAMRVNSLLTQIETSYALTAKLQNMSLMNYLPVG
jgi:flagellar hook-associated protein 3 FlgL